MNTLTNCSAFVNESIWRKFRYIFIEKLNCVLRTKVFHKYQVSLSYFLYVMFCVFYIYTCYVLAKASCATHIPRRIYKNKRSVTSLKQQSLSERPEHVRYLISQSSGNVRATSTFKI